MLLLKREGVDSDSINLYITLAGTFLGVLIAVIVNSLYESLKKKVLLTQYYSAAIHELDDISHAIHHEYTMYSSNLKALSTRKRRIPIILDRINSDASFREFFSAKMIEESSGIMSIHYFQEKIDMIADFQSNILPQIKKKKKKKKKNEQNDVDLHKYLIVDYFCSIEFAIKALTLENKYMWSLMTNKKVRRKWDEYHQERNVMSEEMQKSEFTWEKIEDV